MQALIPKKKRFSTISGVDLSYITDHLIVTSFVEETLFTRGSLKETKKFLDANHEGNYRVFNLAAEKRYSPDLFYGRVTEFPIEDDHPPTLDSIHKFIQGLAKWLDSNPLHVVCIHCDRTKKRTAMMVACWLLYTQKCYSAVHAMQEFTTSCNKYAASTKKEFKGLIVPSQMRYIQYYEKCISNNAEDVFPRRVILDKITMHSIPAFTKGGCTPWLSISRNEKTLFLSKPLGGQKGKVTVDFDCNGTVVDGDIALEFFDGKFSLRMFRAFLNTAFIKGGQIQLHKRDLDGAADDTTCKHFLQEFKIILHFKPFQQRDKVEFGEILSNPVYIKAFHQFLASQHNSENLLFYLEVQRFKNVPPEKMAEVGHKIVDKYVRELAELEINIDADTRQKILQKASVGEMQHSLFEAAEREVYALMKQNSYYVFLISNVYNDIPADNVNQATPIHFLREQHARRQTNAPKPDFIINNTQGPVCASCFKEIDVKDQTTIGYSHYHIQCLKCHKCNSQISGFECVLVDGKYTCSACTETFFPKCFACKQNIADDLQVCTSGARWHRKCFVCCVCHKDSISTNTSFCCGKLFCDAHHPERQKLETLEKGDETTIDVVYGNKSIVDLKDAILDDNLISHPSPDRSKELDILLDNLELQVKPQGVPVTSQATKFAPTPPITQKCEIKVSPPTLSVTPKSEILCNNCKAPITSESHQLVKVEGIISHYHTSCLVCSVCCIPLAGKLFTVRNGELICEADAKQLGPVCEKCRLNINNKEMVVVEGKKYHVTCFACASCGLVFGNTTYYYILHESFYCNSCHRLHAQ